MGHIIELVLEWVLFGLLVGIPAGVLGFVVRAVGKREWTTLSILEGAFAIGAVMGFVVMVFVELLG